MIIDAKPDAGEVVVDVNGDRWHIGRTGWLDRISRRPQRLLFIDAREHYGPFRLEEAP